ncbi:MAG: AbrB/MazE/SpoVT family DNA-binding domain-containing protein [Candidatus Bipolaricaulota bacterium]|nr:AbrB/MazE/SpoVT family DNA-binding domain-containing protein [Candidatus Bipolaricaulota bacterium]
MAIVKIMQRRQVVIPKELFDSLQLNVGDYLEVKLNNGKLEYVPKELVDRDEWYASPQGRKAIATSLREIKTGKGKEFATVEELTADLDS